MLPSEIGTIDEQSRRVGVGHLTAEKLEVCKRRHDKAEEAEAHAAEQRQDHSERWQHHSHHTREEHQGQPHDAALRDGNIAVNKACYHSAG